MPGRPVCLEGEKKGSAYCRPRRDGSFGSRDGNGLARMMYFATAYTYIHVRVSTRGSAHSLCGGEAGMREGHMHRRSGSAGHCEIETQLGAHARGVANSQPAVAELHRVE